MAYAAQERLHMPKALKKTLVVALIVCTVVLLGLVIPPPVLAGVILVYVIFDVSRNQQNGEAPVLKRYFTGNGLLTWTLSPLNLLMDLLRRRTNTVPAKSELPAECQKEIDELLAAGDRNGSKIEQRMESCQKAGTRLMLLYKWYGRQLDSSIPELNKDFKYVKTIGVSVFNANASTSYHYGPLRITYRLLYNMNKIGTIFSFRSVASSISGATIRCLFSTTRSCTGRSIRVPIRVIACLSTSCGQPTV